MSNAIPKEKQTAYERWELASFGDTRSAAQAEEAARQEALAQAEREQQNEERVAVMLQERLAVLREQAYADGYAAGLVEGREIALAEGRIETAKEAASIRNVALAFGGEVAQANEIMAQDMLDLTLDLAQGMLSAALKLKPELVLPVISAVIGDLPTVVQPANLNLHPDDAAIVREHMAPELAEAGWRIQDDATISRGGCRVNTGTNQIDARIETRWQRIAAALSQESTWLKP